MAVTGRKRVGYALSFVAASFFVVWGGVMEYWRTNAPHVPEQTTAAIYPVNYHGTFVYLTYEENLIRYLLPGSGILMGIVVFVLLRDRSDRF